MCQIIILNRIDNASINFFIYVYLFIYCFVYLIIYLCIHYFLIDSIILSQFGQLKFKTNKYIILFKLINNKIKLLNKYMFFSSTVNSNINK